MKCAKCGKELTDGRRKICKECAEKEKKEKEEMKAKKAEQKANNKKVETNNKEESQKKEEKTKKISKGVIVGIVVVLLIVIAIVCALLINKKGIGNTIGNIRNYGYSAINGNYIYYLAPNEDSTAVGIFKIKKDGTGDPEELFMEDMDVISINVYNGYIYFIGVGPDAYSDDDELDNKIYRMTTSGKNMTVINDNEFNNDCYEIYVIDGSIYYIGTDNNIYKMSLDGSNVTLVSDNATGYLGITDKYIIYNVETEDGSAYTTYIMNIDGTEQREIIEGERLYSVNISDDYIYYTNIDKQIYRTKLDSGEAELILDTTAYNLNLNGDYIYYLNYKDLENADYTVCLFRIKADGSEDSPTTLKELDTYSSFINIVGDWVVYMDSNDTEGFINLVKTDGSDEKCLYLLDYENYYSSISSDDYDEEDYTDKETVDEETVDEGTVDEETVDTTTEEVVE